MGGELETEHNTENDNEQTPIRKLLRQTHNALSL
ncbi:hypothetical protein BKA07_002324 [Brevibacterium marinum]|uniref:Uncharacterized protein n=1 Tax=Brevibacterium marinum TaxID=418643 RepID=A0A846RU21_9MICO|nr:hypothetical protein [Brevibacterium marinum]